MQDFDDRLPPHSIEAEQCLLGSLMLSGNDEEAWSHITATIHTGSFFNADHGIIFAAIHEMRKAGRQLDGVTLAEELKRAGNLEPIGGIPYLAKVINSVPSPLHWRTYAGIVTDAWQRRELIRLSDSIRKSAYQPMRDISTVDIAANANNQLAAIVQTGTSGQYERLSVAVRDAYDRLGNGECGYVPSGFSDLDEAIGGFGFGEMWIIGARPSMGKSTLCRQIAVQVARTGVPVGFVSLEESRDKISRNVLAAESGIDNHRIRKGMLDENEWRALSDGLAAVEPLPIFLTKGARSAAEIRAIATALKAREKIQLLIIDYLQRVRVPGKDRYEKVTEISLEISEIAKVTGLAVVAPAQLNRALENRPEKRPTMADLRESGQIEQDADGILFLHREDYYGMGKPGYLPSHNAELIIAKVRDGMRARTVYLGSDLRYQRFTNIKQPAAPAECDLCP